MITSLSVTEITNLGKQSTERPLESGAETMAGGFGGSTIRHPIGIH